MRRISFLSYMLLFVVVAEIASGFRLEHVWRQATVEMHNRAASEAKQQANLQALLDEVDIQTINGWRREIAQCHAVIAARQAAVVERLGIEVIDPYSCDPLRKLLQEEDHD